MRQYLKNFTLIVIYVLVAFTMYMPPLQANVIYQAFNEPFNTLKSELESIKKLGLTHIQVSHPQKSNQDPAWWARYQPIDFEEIQSPLGSEKDLKELILITLAHRKNINLKIIIDVVLNHMADVSTYTLNLKYPKFSKKHFHTQKCIEYDFNRQEVIKGWLGCSLPDLKTETSYVREQAKKYLTKLLILGSDGFRFDSAKHIEPDFFKTMLNVATSDKYSYGEVVGNIMDVTDFHLLSLMIQAFRENGDLRTQHNISMNISLGQYGQKYIMNWGKSNRGGLKIGSQTSLFFIKQLQ